MNNLKLVWGFVAGALIFGCAHAPTQKGALRSKIDARSLLLQACSPGLESKRVSGVVAMKAKSPDASGQFSASIQAEAANAHGPARLKLEALQPFGGTAAIVTIEGSTLRIDVPGKPERSRRERTSWAGIPLNWAAELFLGRIPCPDLAGIRSSDALINDENELVVQTTADSRKKAARFVYRFDEKQGRYWAKQLHWESGTAVVDFNFDDPEQPTFSPLKWDAKSKQGEVKIRWRDREIER